MWISPRLVTIVSRANEIKVTQQLAMFITLHIRILQPANKIVSLNPFTWPINIHQVPSRIIVHRSEFHDDAKTLCIN